KEGVGGDYRTLSQCAFQPCSLGGVNGFTMGDTGRIHTGHLAGADTGCSAILYVDDRVGFDMFGVLCGRFEIDPIVRGGLAAGDDRELGIIDIAVVTTL